jgi:hypothetical protein
LDGNYSTIPQVTDFCHYPYLILIKLINEAPHTYSDKKNLVRTQRGPLRNAIQSKWLKPYNGQEGTQSSGFVPAIGRQDSVTTGPHAARIEQRLSIQFKPDEKLTLGSKMEFLFCSLVAWCWIQARP